MKSPAELRREVAMVVSVAELVIGRAVRSVVDVGCGEGQWYPALRRLRPVIRYTGVDSSEYVIKRFGARRHIRQGTIGALDALGLAGPFDLIVCSGVLNYLTAAEFERGLGHVTALLGGVAYLELFTSADTVTGDTRFASRRSVRWYRDALRRAGLVACGMHCYVTSANAEQSLAALEALGAPPRRSPRSRRAPAGRRA